MSLTLADLDARCLITELPKPSCAHCLGLKDPEIITTVALRRGTCKGCGEEFYRGDILHRHFSVKVGWYGECCD